MKTFHAAKPLAFSLQFLFLRDQNHYFNWTSKIIKRFEQILRKKRQRPNTIRILWIVKKEKVNNSPSYRCVAIKNNSAKLKVQFNLSIDFCNFLWKIENWSRMLKFDWPNNLIVSNLVIFTYNKCKKWQINSVAVTWFPKLCALLAINRSLRGHPTPRVGDGWTTGTFVCWVDSRYSRETRTREVLVLIL